MNLKNLLPPTYVFIALMAMLIFTFCILWKKTDPSALESAWHDSAGNWGYAQSHCG
jgi:short subunit fatty acids transporter